MCPPASLRSLKRVTFAELGLPQKCPRYFGLLAMTFFIRHPGINLLVLKGS
jgi:hypothetical protein